MFWCPLGPDPCLPSCLLSSLSLSLSLSLCLFGGLADDVSLSFSLSHALGDLILCRELLQEIGCNFFAYSWMLPAYMGNVSESLTPTTCLRSTAVHLQFVRHYAPHLYRRTFLASKLRRKGNPAIRPPFVLQYAPHLYGSTFGKILGVGVTGTFPITVEAVLLTVGAFCLQL